MCVIFVYYSILYMCVIYAIINTERNKKITTKQEGTDMTRIEELEKILEEVCRIYEDDCPKCPYWAECEEYTHIEDE